METCRSSEHEGTLESATALLDALSLGNAPSPSLVDTAQGVAKMIDSLKELPTEPPSLYVDLEGVNLSRHGIISDLQIYIHPLGRVYLVDDILESSAIPKVFFDVRNDSDALHHHFQIKLAGILDLQLMELAARGRPGRYVSGLAKCIERDAPLSSSERRNWIQVKEQGQQLFKPGNGGSYQVFNEHPLRRDISLYCAQDVQILPRLWTHYSGRISLLWMQRVVKVSRERVLESQSSGYTPNGRHKALAPTRW
ncbi:ribonuclease H-like domain-containing protein [Trichoderma austrokoningii]